MPKKYFQQSKIFFLPKTPEPQMDTKTMLKDEMGMSEKKLEE